MAQDTDSSKSAAKGKGKAVDDETQKDKAGQPVANGKKDDEKADCLFTPLRPCPACADPYIQPRRSLAKRISS
jgi:hypothetical protein